MKLKKSNPERYLKKIVKSFGIMTKNANLDIKIKNDCKTLYGKRVSIETDWEIYQSIVFNITQNAIKYNLQNGKVDINLSFSHESRDDIFWMNTLISDTGIGIDEERRNFLFKNFGELMAKGQLSQVKDLGIGLGLANSMLFTKALGGDIKILP